MNGDRFVRFADLDRQTVVLDQQPNLFSQIDPEDIRPGHAGLMYAWASDEAIGETRIDPRMSRRRHPDERIKRPHASPGHLAIRIGFETIPEELCIALVDLFEASDGRTGIGECLGCDGLGHFDGDCGTHERRFTPDQAASVRVSYKSGAPIAIFADFY